jgi:hypothetical protein
MMSFLAPCSRRYLKYETQNCVSTVREYSKPLGRNHLPGKCQVLGNTQRVSLSSWSTTHKRLGCRNNTCTISKFKAKRDHYFPQEWPCDGSLSLFLFTRFYIPRKFGNGLLMHGIDDIDGFPNLHVHVLPVECVITCIWIMAAAVCIRWQSYPWI